MRTERSDRSAASAAGQLFSTAAEVYEEFFVPALFGQCVEPMLDAVSPVDGDRLLDIGTGTGVLARAALRRVGAGGSVVAVDPNVGMLAVAQRLTPGWTCAAVRPSIYPSTPTKSTASPASSH